MRQALANAVRIVVIDRSRRISAARNFLIGVFCVLAAGFATPASAVEKQWFTKATWATCFEFDCGNIVTVSAIVPGQNQFEAACQQAWAQVYVFSGDAYLEGRPDGACYYIHTNQPNSPIASGSWSSIQIVDPKNSGTPDCCTGNPINTGTGNKVQIEVDYSAPAPSSLRFERAYNSTALPESYRVGIGWRTAFDRSLKVRLTNGQVNGSVPAIAYRQDGKVLYFTYANGQFTPSADIADRLTTILDANNQITGFRYVRASGDEVETYDTQGRMMSVADRAGVMLTLAYSGSSNRLLSCGQSRLPGKPSERAHRHHRREWRSLRDV